MYVDAEERLAGLVDQNESDGMLFKIKEDPRVFPVGRFLRATSLDELPQLINVLLRRDVAGRARVRCPPTTATSSATSAAGCWSAPA